MADHRRLASEDPRYLLHRGPDASTFHDNAMTLSSYNIFIGLQHSYSPEQHLGIHVPGPILWLLAWAALLEIKLRKTLLSRHPFRESQQLS